MDNSSKNEKSVARLIIIVSALMFISPMYVYASTNTSGSLQNQNTTASENLNPLFAICGTAPLCNSTLPPGKNIPRTSTLPGLDTTQSLKEVLFDNSSASYLMSKAVFDLTFSTNNLTLINGPGYDVSVREIGTPEEFKLTVFDKGGNKSLSFKPASTGEKNICNQDINVAFIDLDAFGVANGASIQTLRVDNLGRQGCCFGSDIAGIDFNTERSATNFNSSSNIPSESSNGLNVDQWNVPLMMPMPSKQ